MRLLYTYVMLLCLSRRKVGIVECDGHCMDIAASVRRIGFDYFFGCLVRDWVGCVLGCRAALPSLFSEEIKTARVGKAVIIGV